MEQLCRLPVKGEGRDWEQGRTWSYFIEVRKWERETRNGISFVGQLGEDTNRTWKTIELPVVHR